MPAANEKIGPYTLIKQLGRGAFGVVWLAERRGAFATTRVALKLSLDEEPDLAAITQESQLWAQLAGHPNVLPIIEADNYDNQVVIVSEYAPDGSLEGWLKKHGGRAPSIESALSMINGILAGLEHLHAQQIIHRDLKPANILLQGDMPRLADFGLARVLKSSGQTAGIAGTPAYMAPETFDGKRSEQSDIWSTGVILYQLLTGNLPFPQSEIISLIGALARHQPAPMPESVPPPFQQVIFRALEKDPANRFASATEMRKALHAATMQAPIDISGDIFLVSALPDEAQHAPTRLMDVSPSAPGFANATDRVGIQGTAAATPATRPQAQPQPTIADKTLLNADNSSPGGNQFSSPHARATLQQTVVAQRPEIPSPKSGMGGLGKILAGAVVAIIALGSLGFAIFHNRHNDKRSEISTNPAPVVKSQQLPDQQTESSQVKELTNTPKPDDAPKTDAPKIVDTPATTSSTKPAVAPRPIVSATPVPTVVDTPLLPPKAIPRPPSPPPMDRRANDPQEAQRQATKALIKDALKQTNDALADVFSRLGPKPNLKNRPRVRALIELKGMLEGYLATEKFDNESRTVAEKALTRINPMHERILQSIRSGIPESD